MWWIPRYPCNKDFLLSICTAEHFTLISMMHIREKNWLQCANPQTWGFPDPIRGFQLVQILRDLNCQTWSFHDFTEKQKS